MWNMGDFDYDFSSPFEVPLESLPPLLPDFFVPSLENKPQNPIMDTLKLQRMNSQLPNRHFQPDLLPKELAFLTLDTGHQAATLKSATLIEGLWNNAIRRELGLTNNILSWDQLKSRRPQMAARTAFLSEQEELVYGAARNHAQPRFLNSSGALLHLNQQELLKSLKTVVLGLSSLYHVWDPSQERFVQSMDGDEQRGFIFLDGKDEEVSESVISRFLKIGTLLRRLELLLSSLRTRSAKEGPTIHAFAHSLSTIIDYLRQGLARCPPSDEEMATDNPDLLLLSIWAKYAVYEEYLVALADLCDRRENLSPLTYPYIDSSPIPLLTRIHDRLEYHYEHSSPTHICAIIAYLLTHASQEYLQEIAASIGFGGQGLTKGRRSKEKNKVDQYDIDAFDDDEGEEDVIDLLDEIKDSFPAFFPQKVLQALPAAQKSLILFQIAQPDSPYLTNESNRRSVRWLWTASDILAAWNGKAPLESMLAPQESLSTHVLSQAPINYLPGLSEFQLYDLEPGESISNGPTQVKENSYSELCMFIDNFPPTLPPIVPTLPELISLVFKDLLDHASTLSSSLLSIYVNSPGVLNFHSHLVLLRSYLLVASPAFKSRLLDALFSDSGEYGADVTAHSMTIQSLRRRPGKQMNEGKQPWAVGLSPHLLERETWPPVGADLSFFLRTVIVDSLDPPKETDGGKIEREQIVAEAEWRLGFAIRDLPTGTGRDKWLNPLSIEALDFLYMDYKPPRPLEILISPEVLAKYQRIFSFILRLFRVESALKSLFRMSTHRAIATYLFPTLTSSRKLLHHFRFIAQAFVSSLSGYVFDTAIGGNFDPFLAGLSDNMSGPDSAADGNRYAFSDVFELAQRHSSLLDDILSACLLRSGQRGVGDLLRQCLELVLEFTVVTGELHRGRLQEYQAGPLIEDIFRKFTVKTTTFIKVLKGIVDKGASSTRTTPETPIGHLRRPTGGLDALYHLLTRLDLSEWWGKSGRR